MGKYSIHYEERSIKDLTLSLVTNNIKEFERVISLHLENWVE